MSLRTKLGQDLRAALKAKDRPAIDALRGLNTAIVMKEKQGPERQLSEEEIIEIVQKEIRKRQEAISAYQKGGREDLVQKEQAELAVLRKYLPAQLSDEALKDIIQQAIEQTGAESLQDMGKVMGRVMPQVKGRAEGGRVSALVQEALARPKAHHS